MQPFRTWFRARPKRPTSRRRRVILWLEALEKRTVPAVYTPLNIQQAYGFDLVHAAGYKGAGQTIAIVDAYDAPNIEQDLANFNKMFKLETGFTFTKVMPQGQPAADTGWSLEASLDVQWAHAIAPEANIVLVEAKSNSFADMLAAVDYAATQTGATVVSMSWGANEFRSETSAAYDGHFANRPGVTFVAASGDYGSPLWPAVSPYVVAVCGTKLTLDSSGNYVGETAWGNGFWTRWSGGSGGGISKY